MRKTTNPPKRRTSWPTGMEPAVPSLEFATSLNDAWGLMRRHARQALPVVDRGGRVIGLLGLTAVAWYHTLAGIRHLYWDSGRGFEIPTMYLTGRAVLIGTAALTALTWLIMLITWI